MNTKRQTFNKTINATPEKVWEILWEDESYRKWTSIFSEGSFAETDWKVGGKARFLTPDGMGMISKIKANNPFKFMSIEHLGIIENGQENTQSPEAKKWSGAMENYTLKKTEEGKTEIMIEMDIIDSYKNFFLETWPKALQKVKELAEKQ
ncbi:SRPBCC domain-containing protein [Echinicola salinicaeni]|uniref:SRPBCC domain-containing protein n=1 Tax=Echinicola salinicaeni TaxID=2762757 RepID=UPI0016457B95|nr:SRPBCC domain-containing protein [Echinicola salinicaeni]